ncbi:MAG: S9 family peptidase [Candidatus Brocadiae bacterium]|nr:S9 family peptidase [Candidatus Brocadiia bacterium]
MKGIFFILFLMLVSMLAAQKRPIALEDLWAMKRIADPQVSPCGKFVVYTLTSYDMETNKGNSDLWLVPVTGGEPKQLTNTPSHESNPRWSPDGSKIAFLADANDLSQIFTLRLEDGKVEQATSCPVDVEEFVWSPDGKHFLFIASVYPEKTLEETAAINKAKQESKVKARVIDSLLYRHWNHWTDGKFRHAFLVSTTGGKAKDLTPGAYNTPPISLGGEQDYILSPDSQKLYFVRNTDPMVAISTNNDIFCADVNTGKIHAITTNRGNDHSPVPSPDGKYLAYLSMAREGFEADQTDLMLISLETGKVANLTEDFDRDAEYPVFAPNGYIYFLSNNHHYNSICRVKIEGGPVEKVIPDSYNNKLRVACDGSLIFIRQAVNLPYEVFCSDPMGSNVKQITFANKAVLDQLEMNPVEDFWFESFDGWRVHGLLVKPPQFNPEKKYPVVFLIHGGPQGGWSDDFHYRWNLSLFAAPGYVVIAINFRGSKGYGQKFCDAVSGDWGGGPYQDLMVGLDAALQKFSFLDGNRVGAAGASYGGYMVNWIAGKTNRFKCLISHAGVFDLVSKYGSTEELWFPEWEFRGTPYQNNEQYHRFSPSRNASRFETPTMVTHGELDFRVPITQGLQMFTALQRQGVPSRLLYFPDEGHFIAKPQNSRLWWTHVHEWFARWLK